MKVKQAVLLAVVGLILNILPTVLNIFLPFASTFLINIYMRIPGSILMVIFFYVLLIGHQETPNLKNAGVFGLVGYLIIIASNISILTYNYIFTIDAFSNINYTGLVVTTLIFNRLSFFISIVPIVMILICFIFLLRKLNKKDPIKKVSLFAFIGQLILIVEWIINSIVYNMFSL